LKRHLDFIFRLFPDKRFEMRNSAFFLNGGISHFFCRRFYYPSQKPSGRGVFCIKTKVWADLGNQTRENLCEKRDFGQKTETFGRKHRNVFEKTFLRLKKNTSAFESKCTCVLGDALLGVLRREGE